MEKTTVVDPSQYNEDLVKKEREQTNVHPELHEIDQVGAYDGLIDEVDQPKK